MLCLRRMSVTSVVLVVLCAALRASCYTYQTNFFTVPVDHFSFTTNATFKMRYLLNDTFWNKNSGPILFYTGNEGDITMFAENTGFMWDIADEFKASVVFAEHRYYGKSMPFGNQSFSSQEKLGYLTAHQALEDYVDLITFLRGKDSKVAVIALGGSYGGMLAAWFRMKYPHIVQGAIAASAPILEFEGMSKCSAFNRILTSDYRTAGDECAKSVRKSWDALTLMSKSNEGLAWLSKSWRTCKPLSKAGDVAELKEWLVDVYTNLAMTDYPYATSFLMPLPANPIVEVCQYLKDSALDGKPLLGQVFKAVSVYFNYTSGAKCLDVGQSADGALGTDGWDYQACTEMVMPICSDGVNDMFEPKPWDLAEYASDCAKKFAWVKPEPQLVAKRYGGLALASLSSNIIFSNGLKDPWTSGGVVESLSDSVLAKIIPEGAHHLDLRAKNDADPRSVTAARNSYKKEMKKWIAQFYQASK